MVTLSNAEINILEKIKTECNNDWYSVKEKLNSNIKTLTFKSISNQAHIKEIKSKISKDPTFPYVEHDPTTGEDYYYAQLLYWQRLEDRTIRLIRMNKNILKFPPISNSKKGY